MNRAESIIVSKVYNINSTITKQIGLDVVSQVWVQLDSSTTFGVYEQIKTNI